MDTLLFNDTYRIPSSRLSGYDYSRNGYYFVTICTKNHASFLGYIKNNKMTMHPIGTIAERYFQEIPNHFPFTKIDALVVMPNHIHGILIIDKPDIVKTHNYVSQQSPNTDTVKTHNYASLRSNKTVKNHTNQSNKFGPQSKNLASIMRAYKSSVKRYANQNKIPFTWQPRYYDHIIRNDKALYEIRKYILNNPKKWTDDKYYLCKDE